MPRTGGWLAGASRDSVYRRSLAAADACAAIGALFAGIVAGGRHPIAPATFATVPLIVFISKLIGTYDREDLLVRKSSLDEAPQLFQLATVYALTTWLIDGILIAGTRTPRELLIIWMAAFVLLIVFRAAARGFSRISTLPERCLVIGDADACYSMHRKFDRRRALHAVVVAGVAMEELQHRAPDHVGVTREALEEIASRFDVDRLIVTPGIADEETMGTLVRVAISLGLKVSLLPTVLEAVGSGVEFDDVEGMTLLSMRPLTLSRSSQLLKRSVDLAGAGLGTLALSPFLAAIALAIKLDSAGPVLFRQSRIGRDGKPFSMLKFRTMVTGAEDQQQELRHLNEAEGLFKISDDPRITRVGRWLRHTSLDELPQLLNVLRGEMSVVGPRPLVADEDRRIAGWHRRRLRLKPGMTGHWQILGSARIPLDDMARIDYLYVTNWSLWLDVKILLRTIPFVLTQKGI